MSGDPLSGAWTTGGGEFLHLRYDGERTLAGVLTAGGLNNIATAREGSFDPQTGAIKLEGQARNPRDGQTVTFQIDGTLAGSEIKVSYRFGADTGNATLTRVTLWRVIKTGLNALKRAARLLLAPPRPTPPMPAIYAHEPREFKRRTSAENEQLMRERGENPAVFAVREVREDEIDNLSWLHVVTWAATYPDVAEPPTFAIRSWQWRTEFAKPSRNWFCYVVENGTGELVGFAKGVRSDDDRDRGDLSKIYMLGEYQQLGLGKRMLGKVTRRFIEMGVTRMNVNAEADNPSCRFYEATGAVNTIDAKTGKPEGGSYVWRDLPALSARCSD